VLDSVDCIHCLFGCQFLGHSVGWIGSIVIAVHCFASHPEPGRDLVVVAVVVVVERTQCLDLVLIADPVGGLVDDSGAVDPVAGHVADHVVHHAVDHGLDGSVDAVLAVLVVLVLGAVGSVDFHFCDFDYFASDCSTAVHFPCFAVQRG